MECFKQSLHDYNESLTSACAGLPCKKEQACFFDIETTGLSPKVSSLYLVGVAYIENNTWQLIQWFANDYTSEKEILTAFSSFVSQFETLIHYNGSTFDIPYLQKKYDAHDIESPFHTKNSIDLYRQFPIQKNIFGLQNKKLSTLRTYLGFPGCDCSTGKECISFYTDFMQKKYFHDSGANELKDKLLLHNHDDILGTIYCCEIFHYNNYEPNHPCCCSDENYILLSDKISAKIPLSFCYEQDDIQFSYHNNTLTVRIPLYEGTLYHYYEDYQNYYYLPEEDTAIHKSVGAYVDSAFRKKATATNCYTKKDGKFLPIPSGLSWSEPTFQESYRSKICYISWTDESKLSQDDCISYLTHLMKR